MFTSPQRSNENQRNKKRARARRGETKRERVYKTIVKDVVFAFHVYASNGICSCDFFFMLYRGSLSKP